MDHKQLFSWINSTIKDCCKDYTQFQRNFSFTSRFSMEIQCEGCVATATVSSVRDTNLLLVLDHTPECLCEGVQPMDIGAGSRSSRSEVQPDCEMKQEETEYYVGFQSCIKDPSLYSSPCSSGGGCGVGRSWVVVAVGLLWVLRLEIEQFRGGEQKKTCYT